MILEGLKLRNALRCKHRTQANRGTHFSTLPKFAPGFSETKKKARKCSMEMSTYDASSLSTACARIGWILLTTSYAFCLPPNAWACTISVHHKVTEYPADYFFQSLTTLSSSKITAMTPHSKERLLTDDHCNHKTVSRSRNWLGWEPSTRVSHPRC